MTVVTRRFRWWAVAGATVLAACSGAERLEDDTGQSLSAGLCQLVASIEAGDEVGAERVFHGRLHDPLHELAATSADVDRAAAARLLEAKSQLESAFEVGADVREMAEMVDTLQSTVTAAGASLNRSPLEPCTDGGT